MRRTTTGFLMVFFVLLLGVSANAFDGQRKGKILGMGFGLVPAAPWRITQGTTFYQSGWSFRMFLGYAWNDKTMITLHASADFLYNGNDPRITVQMVDHTQSLELTRYLRSGHRSMFWRVGLGRTAWATWTGHRAISFVFGGGYAFAKGFQCQLDVVTGPGPSVINNELMGMVRLELVGMIY